MTLQFIAPTKRRSMTKARAARIFLDANGICCNCGLQIRQGEQWFVEHGMNIMERVVSLPVAGKGYEGRRTFECDVVNEITGQPIHLLKTEGLEHYGPPLYREPQYVSRDSKGKWKAHLVGQPAKETTN